MNFDDYALNYDAALGKGLCLSGESSEHFARRRAEGVATFLRGIGLSPRNIVEFGCGIGNNIPFLRAAIPHRRIIGLDVSDTLLDVSRQRYASPDTDFLKTSEFNPSDAADLVYVNGVLHHIPARDHRRTLDTIHSILNPGGLLALFDNNPFSPGARLVMSRIPFDRDAVMVSPYRLAGLIRNVGFSEVTVRFYFIFPRLLSRLRWIEPHARRLPLGSQYCIFARKS